MKSNCIRALALLLALCLLSAPLCAAADTAPPDGSTIYLESLSDFLNFAQQCTLDTWSQGKTVVLTCDLNLAGSGFTPIATFGGTFDGGGYTISGFSLRADGSVQGLFRYLQPGSMVKNLRVRGTVSANRSCDRLGGICGSNAGTIANCSFSGTVSGNTTIGGICGENLETGHIINCTSQGAISGSKNAGGICGKNLGTLSGCSSSTDINTTLRTNTLHAEDLELNAAGVLDSLTLPDSSEDTPSSSFQDAGGICGYSSGIIQSCTNTGTIGYPHLGYNVGGICGRQAGFLTACINNGTVYGRKDAGGIVGQMEPDISIQSSGHSLEDVQDALSVLRTQINRALDHADGTTADLSDQLSTISTLATQAENSAHSLLNQTGDFIDGNVEAVNQLDWISTTLDRMDPILADATAASDHAADALDQMRSAIDDLELPADLAEDAVRQLKLAASDLADAGDLLSDALKQVRRALQDLANAIRVSGDAQAVQQALDALFGTATTPGSLQQLSDAIAQQSEAQQRLSEALKTFPLPLDEVLSALTELNTALSSLQQAVSSTIQSGATLFQNLSLDWSELQSAVQDLADAMKTLSQASASAKDALVHLHNALDTAGDALDHSDEGMDQLWDASGSLQHSAESITDALDGLHKLVQELSEEESLELVPLGDAFRTDSDALHSSLLSLSGKMEDLNALLTASSQTLSSDLRSISDQFYVVMTLLIDLVTDASMTSEDDWSNLLSDQSEADISGTRWGKVSHCANTGTVEADRNVGGIVGAMGIEYDLDPEDDTAIANPLGELYETRAILEGCINRGSITGKKDCAGGAVGRMDLGLAIDCESYAAVTSSDGNYVGGIAGYSSGVLRHCFSKSTLSGDLYLGGIAGGGETIENCAAITDIAEGNAYLGAIAGSAEVDGVTGCYFVADTPAGIDGISYAGHAAPVSFEALQQMEDLPAELLRLTVTFQAGDVIVDTLSVPYGHSLYSLELPAVPKREGYYGVWEDQVKEPVTTDLTIQADYTALLTVLASAQTVPDTQKSLALAEGSFTEQAQLNVMEQLTEEVPMQLQPGQQSRVWSVQLVGTGLSDGQRTPLRLYCPEDAVSVWCQDDTGSWHQVPTERSGQYLLLDMDGTQATYCIIWQKANLLLLCFSVLGALALAVLLLLIHRRRKRKKASKDSVAFASKS